MNPEELARTDSPVVINPVTLGSQMDIEHCPWCDSVISRARFQQIQSRISEQERQKLAQERARIQQELRAEKESFEARVTQEAQDKLTAMTAKLKVAEDGEAEARQQAAIKLKEAQEREVIAREQAVTEATAKAQAEAAEKLTALAGERDAAAAQLKEAQGREAEVREQAATKLREAQEREAFARQEAAKEAAAKVQAEADEKLKVIATERDEASAKLQELTDKHQEELTHQRSIFEQDRDGKLRQQAAEHSGERDKWQKKIEDLNRQLQHKTPNELGDGPEVDIYETLRDSFIGDAITRIKKGQPGADIRHGVVHKGAECGAIMIDSKNRQAWRNDYVTKLREDQMTDKADHAVLATNVFPAGKKELYVDKDTGVVVVSRARAVEVVGLLRDSMLRMHRLGLSQEQRAEKRELLYRYLTSEEYRQHAAEAVRLTQEMVELDIEETKTHQKVWEKRGRMTTQMRNALRTIDAHVGAIIERKTEDAAEEEAAR